MSPSRRDLIKYATAGAFLASLPAADAAAAMRALEVPHSPVRTLDPGTFAQDTHGCMGDTDDLWNSCIVPVEWATYKQAKLQLETAVPALTDRRHWTPVNNLDDAVVAMMSAAHAAGLRQGASFEHLRRSLVVDHSHCRTCWGVGVDAGAVCGVCGGSGVVPFSEGGEW